MAKFTKYAHNATLGVLHSLKSTDICIFYVVEQIVGIV